MFYVYILRTSGNTLYIGQTNDVEKRLKEHRSHSIRASKYVRSFSSVTLVYQESFLTRNEAMRREAQLKKWPKHKKEALIVEKLNINN